MSEAENGRHYSFRRPRSPVLANQITKASTRSMVDGGVYPRGCIWVPGVLGGENAMPQIGALFAPDPDWKPAERILTYTEVMERSKSR